MTALVAVPDVPGVAELSAESNALVEEAGALVITDEASFRTAAEFGMGVKALQAKILNFFKPHKSAAHSAWRGLCDSENAQLEPAMKAERIVKGKLLEWSVSELKREKAEREAAEQRALALAEESALQQAIDAEEDGDVSAAEEILRTPIEAPMPIAQRPAAKVSGVAIPKRWTFDETTVDVASVIKHLAGIPQDQKLAHPELLHLLRLDSTVAHQLITAMKGQFQVPGIRAYEKGGVSLGKM